MAVVKCPSCGTAINVVEKKTGLWWGIGCLIAVFTVPVIVAVVGILAAIAIPAVAKSRDTAQRYACAANLKMIGTAKEHALVEKEHISGEVIPDEEVAQYLKKELGQMSCPKGGRYSVNPAGQDPACSVHGTVSQATQGKSGAMGSPAAR